MVAAGGNAPPPSGSKPDELAFIRSRIFENWKVGHIGFHTTTFNMQLMDETCTRCIFHASPTSWPRRFPLSTGPLNTSHVAGQPFGMTILHSMLISTLKLEKNEDAPWNRTKVQGVYDLRFVSCLACHPRHKYGQDLLFRGHLRSPQPKTHEGLLMFLVRHPPEGWRYTQ